VIIWPGFRGHRTVFFVESPWPMPQKRPAMDLSRDEHGIDDCPHDPYRAGSDEHAQTAGTFLRSHTSQTWQPFGGRGENSIQLSIVWVVVPGEGAAAVYPSMDRGRGTGVFGHVKQRLAVRIGARRSPARHLLAYSTSNGTAVSRPIRSDQKRFPFRSHSVRKEFRRSPTTADMCWSVSHELPPPCWKIDHLSLYRDREPGRKFDVPKFPE